MVDVLGKRISVGDTVLRASTKGHEGITWTTHKVIGFTPKYLKVEPDDWTKKVGSKDYQLIMPFNSLVINEEDAKYLED